MLVGTLSAQAVRQTYLRGIDLGTAWQGPGADQAINMLLLTELSRAEELMAIHFQPWRVGTVADPTTVVDGTYDEIEQLLPYTLPDETTQLYTLTFWHHDVQAITRLRLWMGGLTYTPPLDLTQMTYSMQSEALAVPATLIAVPEAGMGWAVDYQIGLGRVPLSVVQWCSLGVAIQVLGLAGSAADVSHGLAAEQLTMDGITEKVTYGGGNSGKSGGLYAGPIAILQQQRDQIDLANLRMRYQNTRFPVPGSPAPPALAPTRP